MLSGTSLPARRVGKIGVYDVEQCACTVPIDELFPSKCSEPCGEKLWLRGRSSKLIVAGHVVWLLRSD